MYRKAHDKLYELWGNKRNRSEEQWRGIFKLLFADKYNPERFRQGFSQMFAVQYNQQQADRAFEVELRRLKEELPKENFCTHLANYLRQGDWRKADEETAWLFYLVMVQQGYTGWYELFCSFPIKPLNKIDQLWVDYSQEHFGFSIQRHIWETARSGRGLNTWDEFTEQVGWKGSQEGTFWYYSLSFSTEFPDGYLPFLAYCYHGSWVSGGDMADVFYDYSFSFLFSRLKRNWVKLIDKWESTYKKDI